MCSMHVEEQEGLWRNRISLAPDCEVGLPLSTSRDDPENVVKTQNLVL